MSNTDETRKAEGATAEDRDNESAKAWKDYFAATKHKRDASAPAEKSARRVMNYRELNNAFEQVSAQRDELLAAAHKIEARSHWSTDICGYVVDQEAMQNLCAAIANAERGGQ